MRLISTADYTIEDLTDVYNRTRIDYLVPMPMTPKRLEEYVWTYDIDLDASVVAEVDGEPLGLCMLGLREGRGWISRLGVVPTTRRYGAGRAMMNHCIDEAAGRGAAMMYLEVIEGNTPAHTLFLRLGFREIRKLLVLRRPPGPPPPEPIPPPAEVIWLDEEELLYSSTSVPWRPAWTNQIESLTNVGSVVGLRVAEGNERQGWVSFEKGALQLKRVIISPDNGFDDAPAYNLLYHLHSKYPTLDTIAENVPTHVSHLQHFWAHGYVQSFARVEMELPLTGMSD